MAAINTDWLWHSSTEQPKEFLISPASVLQSQAPDQARNASTTTVSLVALWKESCQDFLRFLSLLTKWYVECVVLQSEGQTEFLEELLLKDVVDHPLRFLRFPR